MASQADFRGNADIYVHGYELGPLTYCREKVKTLRSDERNVEGFTPATHDGLYRYEASPSETPQRDAYLPHPPAKYNIKSSSLNAHPSMPL